MWLSSLFPWLVLSGVTSGFLAILRLADRWHRDAIAAHEERAASCERRATAAEAMVDTLHGKLADLATRSARSGR